MASPRPTHVFITTTLLSPEISRFTDSYGTVIADADHHGLFHFTDEMLGGAAAGRLASSLALAARSSAWFPGAFEPAFLPCGSAPDAAHPDVSGCANVIAPHWAADGSRLVNRPIAPLLQEVFDRPASGQVRRVLLYVVPSSARWPGGLGPGSDVEQRLRAVASAEVVRDWSPVPPASPAEAVEAAGDLGRTAFDAAKAMVLDILKSGYVLTDTPEARVQLAMFDRRVHEAFTPARETDLRAFVATRLAEAATGGATADGATANGATANGATAPKPLDEAVARIARDYVRGPEAGTSMSGASMSGASGSGASGSGASGASEPVQTLAAAWPALAGALIDARDRLATLADRAPASQPEVTGGPAGRPGTAGDEPDGPTGRHSLLWRRAEAAHRVRTYLDFLQARDVARTVARLLDLHVAERSVLPVGVDVQQPVELVQLSADTRSLLDPGRHAAEDKLTGMQLHHFGAFFKASWRANDWMWGRLDGAGWLVHLLLDPRRILSVAEDAGVAPADRADWFLDRLGEIVGPAPVVCPDGSSPTRGQLLDELAFLGSETAPLPARLPNLSRWAARRIQQCIAADELACVARHMRDGQEGKPGKAEREWLARYDAVAPGDTAGCAALLASCPVARQRLPDREQMASPLFIRTLTQAVAVVTAAATAATNPPPFLRPTFATARSVTRIAYVATDKMHGLRARVLLAGFAVVAFGTLAMATQNLVLGVSGLALIGAGTVRLAGLTVNRLFAGLRRAAGARRGGQVG